MDSTTTLHPKQKDYQLKLACPTCGAIARMTPFAITTAGGYPLCPRDGGSFYPAPRNKYVRRVAVATA